MTTNTVQNVVKTEEKPASAPTRILPRRKGCLHRPHKDSLAKAKTAKTAKTAKILSEERMQKAEVRHRIVLKNLDKFFASLTEEAKQKKLVEVQELLTAIQEENKSEEYLEEKSKNEAAKKAEEKATSVPTRILPRRKGCLHRPNRDSLTAMYEE